MLAEKASSRRPDRSVDFADRVLAHRVHRLNHLLDLALSQEHLANQDTPIPYMASSALQLIQLIKSLLIAVDIAKCTPTTEKHTMYEHVH